MGWYVPQAMVGPYVLGVSIVAVLAARSFWIERGPASDGPPLRFGRAFRGHVVTLRRPYYLLPIIPNDVLSQAQYLPRVVSLQVCCMCIMHPCMLLSCVRAHLLRVGGAFQIPSPVGMLDISSAKWGLSRCWSPHQVEAGPVSKCTCLAHKLK